MDLLSLGAAVTAFRVAASAGAGAGAMLDVALGHPGAAGYESPGGNPYFGATVGRVANRISGAAFAIDGRWRDVTANDGANHLHGGALGFSRRDWRAEFRGDGGASVTFSYLSPDDEEGYPGNLLASVRYSLDDRGGLRIAMRAVTDAATPVNLASHVYWNLGGHDSGSESS